MPHTTPLNYRQQRAIDAIDRAAIGLSMAIKANAPDTDVVRQAQKSLLTLTTSVNAVIIHDNDDA